MAGLRVGRRSHLGTRSKSVSPSPCPSSRPVTSLTPRSSEGASEALQAYFDKVGGKPEFKPKTPAAKGRGKRKSAPASTPDAGTSAKRGRRSKASATKDAESPEFKLPEGSWEDHVQAIESIEQIGGDLHVYLLWNNAHKSFHPTTVIRRKCPQKVCSASKCHLPSLTRSTS